MLKKKKEEASASSTSLDLKPSYSTEVAAKPYPTEYKVPKFQTFVGRKDNTKEHVVRLLDSMGAHAYVDLCIRKF